MPARATPTHIGLISNGIHKLEEMYAHVVEDEKVMQKRHSSIFSKNKLKRWAEEQNTYDETSLQKLAALKDTISEKREQLCKTKKELERVFKSMPSSGIKKGVLSRKRKEGKSKAKRRKRRRLENNKEYITSKIFNISNCTGITISKTMLNLGELEKLKQRQHEAGLLAVLNETTRDDDARRCLENKIVECKLNSSTETTEW